MKVVHQIIEVLRHGPATAAEIAQCLGMPPRLCRAHLAQAHDMGVVVRIRGKGKAGSPYYYQSKG